MREIFHPRKGTSNVSASRLQRWAVTLSIYDYDFEYRPSRKMNNADALFRLPLESNSEVEDTNCIFALYDKFPLDRIKLKAFIQEDHLLSQVYVYVKNGWPKQWSTKTCPADFTPYFRCRQALSIEDNCLFYRDRIVIPDKCRNDILKLLHQHHTGIIRMKPIARSVLWWPKFDIAVEFFVGKCIVCQKAANVPKETVTSFGLNAPTLSSVCIWICFTSNQKRF